jgi:hypothetical protein
MHLGGLEIDNSLSINALSKGREDGMSDRYNQYAGKGMIEMGVGKRRK